MRINWKKFGLRIVQGALIAIIPLLIGVGYGVMLELMDENKFVEAISLLLLIAVVPAMLVVTVSYINDKIKGE